MPPMGKIPVSDTLKMSGKQLFYIFFLYDFQNMAETVDVAALNCSFRLLKLVLKVCGFVSGIPRLWVKPQIR